MLDRFCKVRHEIIDAVHAPGNTSAIEPINGWKTRCDGQKKSVIPDRRPLRLHGERRDRFDLVMACIARLVKPDPTSQFKLQKRGREPFYLAINWQRGEIETGLPGENGGLLDLMKTVSCEENRRTVRLVTCFGLTTEGNRPRCYRVGYGIPIFHQLNGGRGAGGPQPEPLDKASTEMRARNFPRNVSPTLF
jgi:hypothetical protein